MVHEGHAVGEGGRQLGQVAAPLPQPHVLFLGPDVFLLSFFVVVAAVDGVEHVLLPVRVNDGPRLLCSSLRHLFIVSVLELPLQTTK